MLDPSDLAPSRRYWAAAVVAPEANWAAVPGCRRGARFLIDDAGCRPSRDRAALFESRGDCLEWMMRHRMELVEHLPGARVRPVELSRWMLGLD